MNQREINFLSKHGLTSDDVYDGRNETRANYRINAKKIGKNIILGRPCNAAGHRLKTRAGHCIQCDPAKLAYATRQQLNGYLYIAKSKSIRPIKVGFTSSINKRANSLNHGWYAGQSDWKIVFSQKLNNAGEIENAVKKKLGRYKATGHFYEKDGASQQATELFNVSIDEAISVIENCLPEIKGTPKANVKTLRSQNTATTAQQKQAEERFESEPQTLKTKAEWNNRSTSFNKEPFYLAGGAVILLILYLSAMF